MKDKETETHQHLDLRVQGWIRAVIAGGQCGPKMTELGNQLVELLNTRPATLEDRACGWVYDADHDYYTTECGEDIAFPEMDRKPPIGREWLKFCSGCGKKALLREAGRVK